MKEIATSKRQQILDVASDLFFRYGFRAVGIDTIIEKSGVAKMSLYRYFPSKDDLIVAYLQQSNEKFWQWFENAISSQAGDPRAQLIALFEALGQLATNPACYGCTFQSTAAEFPAHDHPGHQVALDHKKSVQGRMQQLAEQAGAYDPAMLAAQLLLLMDGAFVAARMFGPDNPAKYVAQAGATLVEAQLNSLKSKVESPKSDV